MINEELIAYAVEKKADLGQVKTLIGPDGVGLTAAVAELAGSSRLPEVDRTWQRYIARLIDRGYFAPIDHESRNFWLDRNGNPWVVTYGGHSFLAELLVEGRQALFEAEGWVHASSDRWDIRYGDKQIGDLTTAQKQVIERKLGGIHISTDVGLPAYYIHFDDDDRNALRAIERYRQKVERELKREKEDA